jgi:RNA polymerase sigma-70 factor (ECF subfamily)
MAPDGPSTDWAQIAAFYGELMTMTPSPVIELNRAAAVGMAYGPEEGLRPLDALAAGGTLQGYYLLEAARADLLRRAGRYEDAIEAYERALGQCTGEPEKRYLRRRLRELGATQA